MALHKLTKKQAILLDDVLSIMLQLDTDTYSDEVENNLVLNEYIRRRKKWVRFGNVKSSDKADINAALYIANSIIKDEEGKPYTLSGWGNIKLTKDTQSFLNNKGFIAIWKYETKIERYRKQLQIFALVTTIVAAITFGIKIYELCTSPSKCKGVSKKQVQAESPSNQSIQNNSGNYHNQIDTMKETKVDTMR